MSGKRMLAAAVVAVAFGSPAFAKDIPCESKPIRLQCRGFEPNWSFQIANTALRFVDAENPKPIVIRACATQPPLFQPMTITTGAPLFLTAHITHQPCFEPSGQMRPYLASVTYRQGALTPHPMQVSGTGCCW